MDKKAAKIVELFGFGFFGKLNHITPSPLLFEMHVRASLPLPPRLPRYLTNIIFSIDEKSPTVIL